MSDFATRDFHCRNCATGSATGRDFLPCHRRDERRPAGTQAMIRTACDIHTLYLLLRRDAPTAATITIPEV